MSYKVAVTGGRNYRLNPDDWIWLGGQWAQLDSAGHSDLEFIHGAAPGVDTEVAYAMAHYGYKITSYPADWDTFGKRAGPMRNRKMAEACNLLFAFPGGDGTADMIAQCIALGKEVRESPTRL